MENRWGRACVRGLEVVIVACLALMAVLVFGNVVLRYAFNSGIAISEEVSRWLFVWITFLGAIVAVRERGHLGTDFLLARLPPLGQRICLGLSYGLMLWCTWLLFSGALAQARINWDVDAPVTGASMAIFYASGVVFAVASGVLLAMDGWRIVTGQMPDSELLHITESEELASVGSTLPHAAPAPATARK